MFKNELFQNVAFELGIKQQFSSLHHLQSNSILEKSHSFIKVWICKLLHGKLKWEDTLKLSAFSFGMLQAFTL